MPKPRPALALAALFALLTALLALAAAPARASDAATSREVSFAGLKITVPSDWAVQDFTVLTEGCIRYDVHAVYLGTPQTSTCPSHLVGHTEAVQVSADNGLTPPADARAAPNGFLVSGGSDTDPDLTVWSQSTASSVTVTGQVGSALQSQIASSVTAVAGYSAAPRQARVRSAAAPRAAGRTTYATGDGFDACSAPSTSTMDAWLSSPFRTIGVYVGGGVRACGQPNLTPSWVSEVTANGWNLIPTYVGRQAPCWGGGAAKIDPNDAVGAGVRSADDAVAQMGALGLGAGNPVYYDMEAYNANDASCVQAVQTFLDAWTSRLHERSYVSGVYGSTGSTIKNMVAEIGNPSYHLPDDLWIADYNAENPHTTNSSSVPSNAWTQHQRIKQYQGGHNETYSGVTINIDRDLVDGAVSGPGNGTVTPPDSEPPVGQMQSPPSNSSVTAGTTVTIGGVFSDNRNVTSVDFYVADASNTTQLVGTDTHTGFGVFQVPWQVSYPIGSTLHFSAVAHDAAGNVSNGVPGTSNVTVTDDITPPTAAMSSFPGPFTMSSIVPIAWSGSDSGSGVATFDVRYQRAGFNGTFGAWVYPSGWQATGQLSTTSTSLALGNNYCFQVRATDYAGNVGTWSLSKCIAAVADDTSLHASSGWTRSAGSGYFGGSALSTTTNGVTLTLANVRADRLAVVASMCSGCGQVDVYFNTSRYGRVNLYSATTRHKQLIVLAPFPYGSGTVTIKSVTSGKTIRIDGIGVSGT